MTVDLVIAGRRIRLHSREGVEIRPDERFSAFTAPAEMPFAVHRDILPETVPDTLPQEGQSLTGVGMLPENQRHPGTGMLPEVQRYTSDGMSPRSTGTSSERVTGEDHDLDADMVVD
ncbi:MAG TPA: hypothetical protein PLU57_09585, partial [Bacteroidales bacterium]|nr:hypothetical protein [Bacteroidales bacterium]